MNPVTTIQDTWPARVRTKIVGTSFEGRQDLLAECIRQGVSELELVRDPINKYDSHAVALEARLQGRSGSPENVRLGYLSNSDRVCSDCGQIVGGSLFDRSRTVKCRECGHVFGYNDPAVIRRGPDVILTCPRCEEPVDLGLAKLVICPSCGGEDFTRGGLASIFSRALASRVRYSVRVTDYTGGDVGSDGKQKSLGCNIIIERID